MKTQITSSPRLLSDRELIDRVRDLARHERQATASLVAHLAELEERRLHVAEGCASIFTYCTEVLHLSEHAAYNRIEAARAARKLPLILEKLADGSVHLTAVRLLAPHLTGENHRGLLDEATHKTTRQVEEIVARIRPAPPVESSVRRLPKRVVSCGSGTAADSSPAAPAFDFNSSSMNVEPRSTATAGDVNADVETGNSRSATLIRHRARVAPLAPDLYKVEFTADAETHRLLCQARELLRHTLPGGGAAGVINLALKVLVQKLSRRKFGANRKVRRSETDPFARPPEARSAGVFGDPEGRREGRAGRVRRKERSANSRYIPAEVRSHVWNRDEGRCAFVGQTGRRCSERACLEFHHLRPFARGGPATSENIQLRCRAHNSYEAELCFGKPLVSERVENVMSGSP